MNDCTCVRGDDGQVKVPRSRCPQHGWVDAPTPAPTLTDEQIGSSPADDAQIDDDVRALVEGESMPEETAWAIIAAVVARAKREERERISGELEAAATGMGDDLDDYGRGLRNGHRLAARRAATGATR